MFESLRKRGELPWATDVLLAISDFCGRYGLWVVGLGDRGPVPQCPPENPRRPPDVGLGEDLVPMVGRIFLSFAVARFCRVLGTLLKNGVPILKALEISRDASGNRVLSVIAKASETSRRDTRWPGRWVPAGTSRMVVEMIAVAEESNTLDSVLVNLSDDLEKRTSRQLDLMVRLLEPIMLILLAGVVLVVVIALLVPVIKMSSTLG